MRHLLPTRLGQVHVRTWGEDGGGVPLVLLHMSPLSSRMFDRVAPLLAQRRLVVCPDRIGFGDSDPPAHEPRSLEEVAAATLDALDALGLDRFDVVGIHTGSSEAVEVAVAAPRRVRSVGIVAVPAFTPAEAAELEARYGDPPSPADDGSHLAWHWAWWSEWRRPEWTAELVHARVLDHLRAGPTVRATYRAVFRYPLAERLARVTQPLLVLAPHDDLWEQTRRALPALPPHATVVELPHLDLEIFTVAPDELARHIADFVEQEVRT